MKNSNIRLLLVIAVLTTCTAILFAQDAAKKTTPSNPELPPGMSQEEMNAMMAAATPGPMQAWLCADLGTWSGECKMWMTPEGEPMVCTSNYVQTSLLGGRFVHQVSKSDMGAMGIFEGVGTVGYDNAKGEFQGWWVDSMGTGMSYGTGSLSPDEKVLTLNYGFFCPMQKKQCNFRQTVTRNDDGSRTMRMFANFPKTGKEYMMMETIYKRTAKSAGSSAG